MTWPALADCSSEVAVQARRDGPSLSSSPGWLQDISPTTVCTVHVSEVPSGQHLRSVRRCQVFVPRVHRSTFGSHFFCRRTNSLEFTARWLAGSSCCYSEHFQQDLKIHLFTGHHRALVHCGCFALSCSTNPHLLTYLLTFCPGGMLSGGQYIRGHYVQDILSVSLTLTMCTFFLLSLL